MIERAIIAGIAGKQPTIELKATLDEVARTLRERVDATYRIDAHATATIDGNALRVAATRWKDAAAGVWLVLKGGVVFDADLDELQLQTADGVGLDVKRLARIVRRSTAPLRMVVIDVPMEHARVIAELDWGPCAVRAVGPGLAERLIDALLPMQTGPVTAGAVAAALGGATDLPAAVLNQRAADAPRADPHAVARNAYLTALRARCDQHAFDVSRRDEGTRCALSAIYEPLYTQGEGDPEREARGRRVPGPEDEAEWRRTAHDRLGDHPHMFLVGDPGSGKTSFLQRLAAAACDAALDPTRHAPPRGVPADPLPVLFELSRLDGKPSPGALLDQAIARLDCTGAADPLPRAIVDAALGAGRLVLLFDGLDEVVGPDANRRMRRRRDVARALRDLATGIAAKCVVVATCRPAAAQAGAQPGRPFRRVDLLPLDDAQITRVAEGWMIAREVDDAAVRSRQLVADLRVHPAVQHLARNPLTLAMICLVLYRQRSGRLPRDRNALYATLITLLLEDRERDDSGVDPGNRYMWLESLAWHWWIAAGNTDPDAALLSKACEQVLRDKHELSAAEALEVVRFFDMRAGLLVWRTVTDEQREYRFAHRSFAEFLVASRLAKGQGQVELRRGLFDANWRHVVQMYVAEHPRRKLVGEPAWDLLGLLLDRAEDPAATPEARAYAAWLAAESIKDWRDVAHAAVPETLGTRIDALQDDLFLAQHAKISGTLRVQFWGAIGRHNRLVERLNRWSRVPAGTFWRGAAPGDEKAFDSEKPAGLVAMSGFEIQRWPVTVAEFARFVDEGGYATARFWSAAGWAWRQAEGVERPARWPQPGRWHQPVTFVSFWEAEAWCGWANEQPELQREGSIIQLPTEAQWEYAARGPWEAGAPVRRYSWGVDEDPGARHGHEHEVYEPSALGAFPGGRGPFETWDQSGNVWEWCCDMRLPYSAKPGKDPHSMPKEANENRVLRGGAFVSDPQGLRVSCRFAESPRVRNDYVGFRCIRTCPEAP